ncbi:MAG TPA: prepilin-type N-terminal cleavage/methylation domain-containing protein [Mycobacteriales bacterium]|nr:prepilin-type N-terminal cleavage/methylation domain-containing protein [Mycobacteriales bacterium]
MNRIETRDDDGFTLVELLVVVIIIGVLSAIALPSFLGQRTKAQRAVVSSDLRNISSAQEAFFVENGNYTDDEAELVEEGFNRSDQMAALEIAVYGVNGASAYCVRAEHSVSGSVAWFSSTAGSISTTNPDPVSCPA